MPKLVAVQAEECTPKDWEEEHSYAEPWKDAETVTFCINLEKDLG